MTIYFLKLCWKNVWRNRRRTLLSVTAIAFAVMALVAIRNYYDAFHEQVIQNVIKFGTGHLLVSAPGYPERSSPSVFLERPGDVQGWLSARPEVAGWAGRVQVQGLLSSPYGSANIVFVGVDADREKTVSRFAANIVDGAYLQPGGGKGVVLGESLAGLLNAKVGDKLVALTQGIDGSIGNELFRVSGIFRTQSDADRSVAFVSLPDARALASLPPDAVHQISIVLAKERALPAVRDELVKTFGAPAEKPVLVQTWMDVQRHVMAMVELDNAVNRLLMFIIVSVAAIGIANSILMSVMERKRELGVMMTVGATKAEIVGMIIVETVIIAIVGLLVGNALGLGVTLFFGKTGFDLAWLTSQKLVIDGAIIQTVSYPTIHWANSISVTLVVLVLALVASVIPARHIAGLQVVKALRPA